MPMLRVRSGDEGSPNVRYLDTLKEVFGCGGCGMRNGGVHLPVFQATAIDLE